MPKIQYQQESCLSYQPLLYCAKVKHSQFPGSLTETLKFNSVSKSYFTQETSVASGELDEEKKKKTHLFHFVSFLYLNFFTIYITTYVIQSTLNYWCPPVCPATSSPTNIPRV